MVNKDSWKPRVAPRCIKMFNVYTYRAHMVT